MKFIIIFLFVSSICFGQKKDSSNKPDSIKQLEATVQAINFVLADMKTLLYGKITADEFSLLIKVQEVYIKEKNEQFNPKKQ